ncbi:hypothetical protein TNCV_2770981 [Trichonephila clavipes]|nr:hypothetical protein TNCV_2770981 [Trichonephila clavipes]
MHWSRWSQSVLAWSQQPGQASRGNIPQKSCPVVRLKREKASDLSSVVIIKGQTLYVQKNTISPIAANHIQHRSRYSHINSLFDSLSRCTVIGSSGEQIISRALLSFIVRAGAARTQPRYQKLCTPSNRCLRMWRTSTSPSAMAGLCSGDPPS